MKNHIDKGYIYIMVNPAFPQYVKIGYTNNVDMRLKTLNRNSGLPLPYTVYATYEVKERLEDKTLHNLIDRLNPSLRLVKNREFYETSAAEAYSWLEAIAEISATKDRLHRFNDTIHNQTVPLGWNTAADPVMTSTSAEVYESTGIQKRVVTKKQFRFSMCNINTGEYITFSKDPSIRVQVISDNTVDYEGQPYTLSALTVKLFEEKFGGAVGSKSYNGTKYFMYNGKLLFDLRNELEKQNEVF